jgi:large subunit ribosomal protein L17
MKHKKSQLILGREANHRRSLLKNLSSQLLRYNHIITTDGKARLLRRYFEPLVTKARGDLTLHLRRNLRTKLTSQNDVVALSKVAKNHKTRPGGYLRLTKLPKTRHDEAAQVRIDIVE